MKSGATVGPSRADEDEDEDAGCNWGRSGSYSQIGLDVGQVEARVGAGRAGEEAVVRLAGRCYYRVMSTRGSFCRSSCVMRAERRLQNGVCLCLWACRVFACGRWATDQTACLARVPLP